MGQPSSTRQARLLAPKLPQTHATAPLRPRQARRAGPTLVAALPRWVDPCPSGKRQAKLGWF